MSLFFKRNSNTGILGIWKIEETSVQLLKKLRLSESEFVRVNTFKLESRKQEYLAVRTLIKELLNIDPLIQYLPSGKPLLKNSHYNLSISHTKGYVSVVLSEEIKIGVDIEIPAERILKVSSRFITEGEDAFIENERKLEYYTLIWSLKETMFKIYDQTNIIFNLHLKANDFILKEEGDIQGVYNNEINECLNYKYIVFNDFSIVYRC